MKKLTWLLATAVALGLSGAALAANLTNLDGQSCGDGLGQWHFVNVQTNGASAGVLTAYFSGTPSQCTIGPIRVNRNEQGFNCSATGALLGASTNLPGRLQLSDLSCGPTKCTDPKGCEPPK